MGNPKKIKIKMYDGRDASKRKSVVGRKYTSSFATVKELKCVFPVLFCSAFYTEAEINAYSMVTQ